MNKNALLIITAILFFGIGYLVNGFTTMDHSMHKDQMEMKTMDHSHSINADMPHDHSMMKHEKLDVSEWERIPEITLSVTEDAVSGWNVHAKTKEFVFSPQNVSSEHIEGEGHAHLYINGVKITRLLADWYHIPELTPGEHEITATLNSNDHNDLAIGDEIIQDTVIITVQ